MGLLFKVKWDAVHIDQGEDSPDDELKEGTGGDRGTLAKSSGDGGKAAAFSNGITVLAGIFFRNRLKAEGR